MGRLFLANLKMMLRNRQALFWMLFFPLMFIVIFGLFFGQDQTTVGTLALVKESNTTIADQFTTALEKVTAIKVDQSYTTVDDAREAMRQNKVMAVADLPANFGDLAKPTEQQIILYTDPGNANSNSVFNSVINGILTEFNYQAARTQPIFTVDSQSSASHTVTYFDFVLVGILGMAMMNSSIMGLAVAMTTYREDQILKRLTTTPLPSWKFIAAEVLSRLILNLVQIGIILTVGVYGFNGHIYGSTWILIGVALIGAICFQLIGFVIAGLSKTTRAAEGMAQSISIPMMFLGGVFFPTDSLPQWVASIVHYLPLEPLLRMLRQVGIDGTSPFSQPLNIEILGGWIIILLIIATRTFRLNDK